MPFQRDSSSTARRPRRSSWALLTLTTPSINSDIPRYGCDSCSPDPRTHSPFCACWSVGMTRDFSVSPGFLQSWPPGSPGRNERREAGPDNNQNASGLQGIPNESRVSEDAAEEVTAGSSSGITGVPGDSPSAFPVHQAFHSSISVSFHP